MVVSAFPARVTFNPSTTFTRWPSRIAPLIRPVGTLATVTLGELVKLLVTFTVPRGANGWLAPLRLAT